MKVLLVLSLFLSVGIFSSVSKKNSEPIMPEPELHRICECNGWFCSSELMCTDAEQCSCSCGVFICKCSCRKDLNSISHAKPHSVSPVQVGRLYEFENFLIGLGSVESRNLSSLIGSMRNNLNVKNYDGYYSDAGKAEESLSTLNSGDRNTINNWFVLKGSDISI